MGNCPCAAVEANEPKLIRERARSMGITPQLFGDKYTLDNSDIDDVQMEIKRREVMRAITITCKLPDSEEERQVTVRGYEAVRPSLCRELPALAIEEVHVWPLPVDDPNVTRWEELGVDADTVVTVLGVKSAAEALVPAMVRVNSHLYAAEFEERITRDPDDPTVLKEVDFHGLGITQLPELFGLRVTGNFLLNANLLTSLPESMGSIKVGGHLSFTGNKLTSLPEDMGAIQVGGDLALHNNQLKSLPPNMESIRVGRDLYLRGNPLGVKLTQADFPKVGGTLWM
jgi:hypothetical protein